MSRFEETVADYQTSEITAGPHLIAHFRAQLKKDGIFSAAEPRLPVRSRDASRCLLDML